MSKKLFGAVLKSHAKKQEMRERILKYFSKDGEPIKLGKKGRPYSSTIEDVANDYVYHLPSGLIEDMSENLELIGGVMDTLVESRRPLNGEEKEYIRKDGDGQVMHILNGESKQVDLHTRFLVMAKRGNKISTVFKKRAQMAMQYAQQEANELNRTLYVLVCRYCVDRSFRDIKTALKDNAPLSGVGLMSKNIFAILVVDNIEKHYKGQLSLIATVTPEPSYLEDELKEIDSLQLV